MPKTTPLFLARRSYRRRRMMDAVRLLPILGAILFLIPAYLHEGPEPVRMSAGGIYLFAIWAGLIVLAFLLARGLGPAMTEEDLPEGSTPVDRVRAEAAALAGTAPVISPIVPPVATPVPPTVPTTAPARPEDDR